MGFFGSADQGIPLDDVQSMKDALAKAGSKSQIHVYDGAPHAFHADYRPTYRKEPAEDGWKRLLAWLRSNGVRRDKPLQSRFSGLNALRH